MTGHGVEAARRRAQELDRDPSVIPDGTYCYSRGHIERGEDGLPVMKAVPCPYWSLDAGRPQQEGGYCAYLDMGDWEGPGIGLLWDQVKECGVRDELEPGEEVGEDPTADDDDPAVGPAAWSRAG